MQLNKSLTKLDASNFIQLLVLTGVFLFLSSGASATPDWRNLNDNVSDFVRSDETVNISAEFNDPGGELDRAYLATNESGSFENQTGRYGSPINFTNQFSNTTAKIKGWNEGIFNGSSADRAESSGNLGIGYTNGTNPSQTNQPSISNLVGFWRFDKQSGNYLDYSGNNQDGSVSGGTRSEKGTFNTESYGSNANGESVNLPDDGSLLGSPDLTVSTWVKPDTLTDSDFQIFAINLDGSDGWGFYNYQNNNIQFQTESGGSASTVAASNILSEDQWTHVVAVYDDSAGPQVTLYANGTQVTQTTVANPIGANTADITVGDYSSSYSLQGNIDNLMIYDQTLTQAQVEKLYFGGRPFRAEYESQWYNNTKETVWQDLEINASVPSDTNVSAQVEAYDSSDSLVDEQVIPVQDGLNNYSLNLDNTVKAKVKFNGTSSNVTKTWEVNEYELYQEELGVGGWNLADFSWQNLNFEGILSYRIWGVDLGGNANSTVTGQFKVEPYSANIENPKNDDITGPRPKLKVTSKGDVLTWKYNIDGGSNTTFTPNTTLPELSDGEHTVKVWANISDGPWANEASTFEVDKIPPEWRRQGQENDTISATAENTLYAQGIDNVTLTEAVLSTNETGTWQNKTTYGSPLNLDTNKTWTWSNFTWQNNSIKGENIAWKIHYSDAAGNWNSTGVKTFDVRAEDVSPPSVVINSPENDSISSSDVWLNASADEDVDSWKYNLDGSGNVSFDSDVLLEGLSEGQHNVTVWANDTAGNVNKKTRYFTVDTIPPKWRNINQINGSGAEGDNIQIKRGDEINLTAEGLDSNNLSYAVLATNETGTMEKRSRHGSPLKLGTSGEWTRSSFIWSDDFITGTIKWKIWYNDTAGNWNSTDSLEFQVEDQNLAPSYQNFKFNVSSPTNAQTINVSAEFRDLNPGLNQTLLATNESGEWKNYTSRYESPNIFAETKSLVSSALQEFNSGIYNLTSASRNDNSGNLGLGYRNGSLEDSLKGFWRLDGESGAIIDYSGNGLDGSTTNFEGDERGSQGIFSTSGFDFDGTDDRVTVSNDASLEPSEQITVSLWVKRDGAQADYAKPLWYGQNTQAPWGPYGFEQSGSSDTNLYFHLALGGAASNTAPVTLNNGEWHHIVGTYDGSTQNIYRDGQLVDSVSITGTINNYDDTNGLGIGDKFAGGQAWSGSIDEVLVYNESLSESEVQELYFNGEPFQGDYKGETITNDQKTDWGPIFVDASVPADTQASAIIETLDENGNPVEQEVIELQSGAQNYSVDNLEYRKSARVLFNGSSSNETKTWTINDYELFYNQYPQEWTLSDFIWDNTSFEGKLGFRLWAQDGTSKWSSTETKTLEIDRTDPKVNIESPENKSLNNSEPNLNVSANEQIDIWKYNLDNNGNTTFTPNITLPEVSDGFHSLVVWARDLAGNQEREEREFAVDTTPPEWRNQEQEKDTVDPLESNTLRAQGLDSVNLTKAVLATNETGSLENKSTYGSPLTLETTDQWTWSNFTWSNESFKNNTLSWKIYYSDAAGNWNSTDLKTFEIRAEDVRPPSVVINSPENESISGSDVWLNASADEKINDWIYNLDGSGNVSFDSDVFLEALSEGQHNVTVWANDTGGNINSDTRYFTIDTENPLWRNQVQEKDVINQSDKNDLSAELYDEINLSRAYLQTNKSGEFENSSRFDSPKTFNSQATWESISFTWTDDFFSGNLSWRIWFEDQAGNINITDTKTFKVIEQNLPPNFQNFQKNTSEVVNIGDAVNISAEAIDIDPGLKQTKIATNASGVWKNYTSQFGSPEIFTEPGSEIISTAQEFRNGSFTGTSIEAGAESSQLKIGYTNTSEGENLLGYWRLNEEASGSGGTFADYSGNGNSGTTQSGVETGSQGIFSTNSFNFNGSNVAKVDQTPDLEPQNQITASMWIKRNGTQVDYAKPLWYGNNAAPYGPYGFEHAASNDTGIQFHIAYSGSAFNNTGAAYIPDNEWVHLAGTYDGNTISLYKNGQLVDSVTGTGTISDYDETNGLGIGDKYEEGQAWSGSVDEVRIINESYSQTQVQDLYFNGQPYTGEYTGETFSNENKTEWGPIEINASVPTNTDLSAIVQVLDENENVAGKQIISITDGVSNYSVDLENRKRARVRFNGTSSNATTTWKINEFELFGDEITERDWIETDFTWQNSSFEGNLGYRIWAQDGTDKWSRTSTGTVGFSDIEYAFSPENTSNTVAANITVKKNEEVISERSTNSGPVSIPVLNNNPYNITQSFDSGDYNTTFVNFDTSESVEPRTQYVDYSNVDPDFASQYKLSKVYAVNDTGLSYDKATIKIPRPDAEFIFHCKDWNFDNSECNDWERNQTSDYPSTTTDTHIIFNVTGFDAFGVGEKSPQPLLQDIQLYDVTGLSQNNQETGGTLETSGLNTTLNLSQSDRKREYRFEFEIKNNGSDWNIEGADEMLHEGLNTSWDLGKIWYNLSEQKTGGTFSGGEVNWNTSKNGVLGSDETMHAKYLVNISTTNSSLYNQRFLVNDTSANSGSQVYHQLNITKYGYLDVKLEEPPDGTTVNKDKLFTGNATVTCNEGKCGATTVSVRYNESSEADTNIPTTTSTPFYINGSSNEKTCDTGMKSNDTCHVSWSINASGQKQSNHLLDAQTSSSEPEVATNDSIDKQVSINEAILLDLGFEELDFGVIDPGVNDKPSQGNEENIYNITVEENSVSVDDLWVKSSNLTASGWGDYKIPVENTSYSTEKDITTEKPLSDQYQHLASNINSGTNVTSYYWIDVPEGIKSGEYNSTITFKANATQ